MKSKLAAVFLVACLGVSAGCAQKQNTNEYASLNPSGNFTLTDDNGKVFHLKDHRGQVLLLFFGYLSCPDVCPTTLSKLARVYYLLGPASQKLLTIFVSVDPQRDTPKKIKEYLRYFGIKSIGLTGTKAQIDAVVKAYGAYYETVPTGTASEYLINHSDYVYLIGPGGKVRHLFHPEDKAEDMTQVIKKNI